jgi:hypothetical protein
MDTSATSNAPSSTSTASPSAKSPNWDQIRFPFDPQLQSHSDLAAHPVGPLTGWHDLRIREEYTCDAGGNLRVKISADPTGYAREFSIAKAARG